MGVNPALSWALSVRRQMPCALCVAAEWECVRVALVHGCNFTITMSIRGYRWGARCESRAAWAQAAGSHANARLSMVSSPCPLGKACSYLMPLVFLSSEVSRGPRCVAGALDRGRARPAAPSGGGAAAGRWDLGIPVDRRACSSSFPCRAPGRVALVARGMCGGRQAKSNNNITVFYGGLFSVVHAHGYTRKPNTG